MKFSYEDLLSGDAIPVDGVGHIRSPQLKELKPTEGIGFWKYNLYLNILSWEKDDLIKFMRLSSGRSLRALVNDDKLNSFDAITILEQTKSLLQEAMAFFIEEDLVWDKGSRCFIVKEKNTQMDVGYINRENFDEVRDMMLQANYINLGRSAKPTKFSSQKAQTLWEQAQQYLKKEATKSAPDKRMQIGNIISKLSCASVGYTLLNIYNLTIFQLYDQFFQYGYLRAMNLSEMAYSNHGGKNFDIHAWLKPITNFEKEQK